MSFELRNRKPNASESEIARLETLIGARLPDDYRQFIAKSNGGIASHGFSFEGSISELVFYSIEGDDDGLHQAFNLLQEHTNAFLPIAGDTSEREYLLPLEGQEFSLGKHLYEDGSTSMIGVEVLPIAKSFSDFLASLVPVPDIECEVASLGANGDRQLLGQYAGRRGRSINDRGKNNISILCEAIRNNNFAVARACIEMGAETEDAVLIAAMNRNCEMLKLLHELGVDLNERDDDGETVIQQVPGPRYAETRGAMRELGAKTADELD